MKTIETVATVNDDGTLVAQAPQFLERGTHRVVIVIDEKPLPADRKGSGLGNMAAFRESLGAPTHPGNTVVEMREEERF